MARRSRALTVLLLPILLAAAGLQAPGASTPAPLRPGDRARGDLTGDPADEDRVLYDLAEGAEVTVRLRGSTPGRGAPTLRVERPGGAAEPLSPVVLGSRVRARFTAAVAGTWAFVVGPPQSGERRDWRLRVTEAGAPAGPPATVDLSDIVAWKGDVGPLVQAQCVRCHFWTGRPMERPRLDTYEAAASLADRIRVRVSDGTMPPDRALSGSQVGRIQRWVDGGTPLR